MKRNRMNTVALLAAPWPIYNRPSIQLGALKAYLKQAVPDLTVDAFHLYLQIASKIGYREYAAVSERTWLAEPIYAALLYPEKASEARALFLKETSRNSIAAKIDFKRLVKKVGIATNRFIAGINWEEYLAAGFTVSLCQLTSTLYISREIKRRFPGIRIVLGGSSVAGESGQGIVSAFKWIDFAVQGEGEKPLAGLIQSIRAGTFPQVSDTPAILSAGGSERTSSMKFDQLESLNQLPVPDYDDYFRLLKSFSPEKRFFPVLPAEMSRGCWWQKKLKRGGRGCAFCNLNTQWTGYRTKKTPQVISELALLKSRYRLLSFALMDNALPVKTSREIFESIAETGHTFSFFGEIRASTDFKTLTAMRQAGLEKVQIGIEALSSRMLQKLNKGTIAIENVEIMKHCEELGIENRSNLIVQFPGSDENDVSRTLRAIEFVTIFRPLKPVRFWLGLGSPVCGNFSAFGIKAHFNHPNYAALFPREICRKVPFVIRAYRGDLVKQRKLWKPVLRRLKEWEKSYADSNRNGPANPVLSYQDGGDIIIIRQRQTDGSPISHRLTGSSREIYLFCRHHRALKSIAEKFPGFSQKQVKGFLGEMVSKKLMFEDDGRHLSLAVRRS
jgi:ribosomal peptide maturation radical SAM protein 1